MASGLGSRVVVPGSGKEPWKQALGLTPSFSAYQPCDLEQIIIVRATNLICKIERQIIVS